MWRRVLGYVLLATGVFGVLLSVAGLLVLPLIIGALPGLSASAGTVDKALTSLARMVTDP